MPQRRNNHHHAAFGQIIGPNGPFHQEHHHHYQLDPDLIENHDANLTRCCVPTECLLEDAIIQLDDLRDVVKVTCNNDHCNQGQYMHRECFETWEQTVLQYLKSCGRARSWSERQRHQNLWTKKGYDLAFKACGCRCGRGHLKKDLDWLPPRTIGRILFEDDGKKKKRKHRQNTRPALAVSAPIGHHHPNSNGGVRAVANAPHADQLFNAAHEVRARAGSLSSSTGTGSPPASSEHGASPMHLGAISKKKNKVVDFFSDRSRHGSGGNGIFSRRSDFSSFNSLPKHKLNSYHIKMEDEGNHGNDDTRCFILSALAAVHASRVSCVLCHGNMLVFDRYPLVDGTFFLSPRQHSKGCLEVRVEGRPQFLSAVCMGCLEGWGGNLRCRSCNTPWDGSSLVLGTMYSYDIFAAMPCCHERIKCNACQQPLMHPQQRLNFFSDYSHQIGCPHCGTMDTHFVKSLPHVYYRARPGDGAHGFSAWP